MTLIQLYSTDVRLKSIHRLVLLLIKHPARNKKKGNATSLDPLYDLSTQYSHKQLNIPTLLSTMYPRSLPTFPQNFDKLRTHRAPYQCWRNIYLTNRETVPISHPLRSISANIVWRNFHADFYRLTRQHNGTSILRTPAKQKPKLIVTYF